MVWQPDDFKKDEALTIPSQVNYVGKGANLYHLGYAFHGSLLVILKYLRTTWLWEKVRVQGGAYGGFVSFDRLSGVLSYLSYRDPNLIETLNNYDGTGNYLRKLNISQDELVKSIIGTIGDIDTYLLPDAKGYTALTRYLTGVNDETRARIREEVLETTENDFHKVADILDAVKNNGHVVVLGSPEAVLSADTFGSGWLSIQKIM